MRRTLFAVTAALLVTVLLAGPAGASGRPTADGTRAYCARLVTMLQRLSGATEASARTPATRRAVVAAMHGAPRGVRKPVDTLGRSLVKLIDRGPKAVKSAEQRRAGKAGDAIVDWGTEHCPAVKRHVEQRNAAAVGRLAQSALRNGLVNAKVILADNDSYRAATVAALHTAKPTITFVAGPTDPTNPKSVSVHVVDDTNIVMAAGSGTTCFYLRDSTTTGTEFAQAPGTACDAATPPATWTTRWR